MAKLWQKGYELNELVERFTVGNDYILDRRLIAADAVASIAHVRMLASIALLDDSQAGAIVAELRAIAKEAVTAGLVIDRGQEDSHTFIEERLVTAVGEAGKRVHTGRSRNDQVLASTRVYAREGLLAIRSALHGLAGSLLELAGAHENTVMGGRTHLQPAMPMTFGLWAASYAETLLDADELLELSFAQINRSPLGAAASFGVPLPLDRELVAELLGCGGIHHNVLAAVSSRAQLESQLLAALDQVGITLSRMSADLVLYSLPELGYVRLPAELCSGSSIMPQKRNPDALELLRGKAATLSSFADRSRDLTRSLVSAYNRDVQESKEPLIRGIDLALEMLLVSDLTIESLEVDTDAMLAGLSPDLFATDVAIDRVLEGESFRDAYRAVAASLGSGEITVPTGDELAAVIARRSATGAPGNLDLAVPRARLAEQRGSVESASRRIRGAVEALVGEPIELYPGAPRE